MRNAVVPASPCRVWVEIPLNKLKRFRMEISVCSDYDVDNCDSCTPPITNSYTRALNDADNVEMQI